MTTAETSVSRAFEKYKDAALAVGVDIGAALSSIPRSDVSSRFEERGLAVHDDVLDYFSIVGSIRGRGAIFPNAVALDFEGAFRYDAELHALAVDAAEDYGPDADPSEIYSPRSFPICQGKPVLLVDADSGRLSEHWWDEPEPRPAHESIAAWLGSLAELLASDSKTAANFVVANDPGRAWRVGSISMFVDEELGKRTARYFGTDRTERYARLVVNYLPVDDSPEAVAFARDRAERFADFVAGDHMPRERITTHQDAPSDRGGSRVNRHELWIDGYYTVD